jgi:colanic acid/amylovoran biosynthesis glycosyltransferase
VRVAYVVSRFPDPSETFVLRELNGVDGRGATDVELFVLFPPKHPFVHPDAARWLDQAHRVGPGAAVTGLLAWLVTHPIRLIGAVGSVMRSFARSPRRLGRSLIAVAIAAAHARTMRRIGVEHIHAHFATYPALAAWLASRLLDVPFSFTAHAHDIFVDQLHLDVLVRDAAAVVVISDYNRAFLAPYSAGVGSDPVLVRCGVDPAAYTFRPRTLASDGPVRAVCVATLNELKGHATLLQALASPAPAMQRVHLDLIGSGPLEAGLVAQVRRLGLQTRVRFLGTLSEPEVADVLEQAEIFVLASVVAANGRMDGIPVALMEALASGVPVIASRLSGIPELVRDGVTGVLVRPGDVDDLVAGFQRTLADPQVTCARAQAGRRLIEREFDIERSSEQMVSLFQSARAARMHSRNVTV